MKAILALFCLALVQHALSQNCGVPAIPPSENFPKETGPNRVERVVGGQVAIAGSWPWQISLRRGIFESHTCGGSVLDATTILCAAHCVASSPAPSNYRVHAGRQTTDGFDANLQNMGVSRVTSHPFYNSRTTDYDVAILKLSSPLTLNTYVSPVCLPTIDGIENGQGYVTGFGNTQNTGGEGFLKQAGVLIVPQAVCKQPDYYGPTAITDRMICGGFEFGGIDTCQGDSGGPFVQKVNGRWEQIGITSWGQGCALYKKPGVYSRVFNLKSWIQQNSM